MALRTLFVYTEFMKKKVYELLTLAAAAPARRHHGTQKVLIPECDLTGRRVMVNRSSSVPVRSHSAAAANVSSSKNLLFHKLCVHKQCSQCSCL